MTRTLPAAAAVLTALLAALALTACGDPNDHGHDHGPGDAHQVGETQESQDEDHAHDAAHGGSVIELGDHAAILEVIHDEGAGEVRLWVTDAEGAALSPDGTPVLNAMAGETPTQIEGVLEDGVWVFRHAALNDHQDGARLRLGVGGRTFSPELPHAH